MGLWSPVSLESVMSGEMRSPRTLAVCWGRMEVEGIGAGKDFKLYPGWRPGVGLDRDRDQARTRHPARRCGRTPGPRRHCGGVVPGHEPAAPGRPADAGLPGRAVRRSARGRDTRGGEDLQRPGRGRTGHRAVPLDVLTPGKNGPAGRSPSAGIARVRFWGRRPATSLPASQPFRRNSASGFSHNPIASARSGSLARPAGIASFPAGRPSRSGPKGPRSTALGPPSTYHPSRRTA